MSTSATNPQLRIQDSINILDGGLDLISSGGVTTSLILPGSGTLMGGEGLAIKLLKTGSFEVEDMTLNRGIEEDSVEKDSASSGEKRWRWMKMACGENAKRYCKNYTACH